MTGQRHPFPRGGRVTVLLPTLTLFALRWGSVILMMIFKLIHLIVMVTQLLLMMTLMARNCVLMMQFHFKLVPTRRLPLFTIMYFSLVLVMKLLVGWVMVVVLPNIFLFLLDLCSWGKPCHL